MQVTNLSKDLTFNTLISSTPNPSPPPKKKKISDMKTSKRPKKLIIKLKLLKLGHMCVCVCERERERETIKRRKIRDKSGYPPKNNPWPLIENWPISFRCCKVT